MKANAPAKVILSGEHAVVYGAPALATAVQHYASALIQPTPLKGQVQLALPDVGLERSYAIDEIPALYQRCLERHRAYLQGRLAIDQVADAGELACCALGWLLGRQSEALPAAGMAIELRSQIPIGAGMGSSAAIGAALLAVVAEHLGHPLAPSELRAGVQQIEQFQHGHSSGLDPAVCVLGGLLRYQAGRSVQVGTQAAGNWRLVHTGRPESSTGECVDEVRRGFADSAIWNDFRQVTESMAHALAQDDRRVILDRLRHNHRLLCTIGVVPEPVQRFIATVEAAGGAAKISGAGSIRGSAGGLVLVYHPGVAPSLALPAGYRMLDMELDQHGTRVRD